MVGTRRPRNPFGFPRQNARADGWDEAWERAQDEFLDEIERQELEERLRRLEGQKPELGLDDPEPKNRGEHARAVLHALFPPDGKTKLKTSEIRHQAKPWCERRGWSVPKPDALNRVLGRRKD
jgi:hypothetical protein